MIVALVIVQIIKVIDVIYVYLECFSYFKVVLNVYLRDPLGIQIVHNDLSLTYFKPLVSVLLKQHTHAISSCESIEIGELLACEREPNSVDEA